MTVEDLISAVRSGFGVTQSAARIQHAALVEAGRFERRSSGASAKPLERDEALALIFSLMATGGKGDGAGALVAAQRLSELVLETIVISETMPASPLPFCEGMRFTDAVQTILNAIATGGLADWITAHNGNLLVDISQFGHTASISLTCINSDRGHDVVVAWIWRFHPAAPGAAKPCCKPDERRLLWTLQTFIPLGQALRDVA